MALAGQRVALFDTSDHTAGDALLEAAAVIVALGAEFVSDLRRASIVVLRFKPTSRSTMLLLRNLAKALPDASIVHSEWLRECWRTKSMRPPAAFLAPEVVEEERIFASTRICLGAFEDGQYRAYCASVLRAHGATIIETALPPECTHVLLAYNAPRQALQALSRNTSNVTPFWLHDCVTAGKLLPIDDERLHRPVAKAADMQGLRISCTMFDRAKREIIRRQILAAGAIPDFALSPQHTHLITPVYGRLGAYRIAQHFQPLDFTYTLLPLSVPDRASLHSLTLRTLTLHTTGASTCTRPSVGTHKCGTYTW